MSCKLGGIVRFMGLTCHNAGTIPSSDIIKQTNPYDVTSRWTSPAGVRGGVWSDGSRWHLFHHNFYNLSSRWYKRFNCINNLERWLNLTTSSLGLHYPKQGCTYYTPSFLDPCFDSFFRADWTKLALRSLNLTSNLGLY
jgi:hypothetical protein